MCGILFSYRFASDGEHDRQTSIKKHLARHVEHTTHATHAQFSILSPNQIYHDL